VWVSKRFEGPDGICLIGDDLIVVEQYGINALSPVTGAVRWSIHDELLKSDASSRFGTKGEEIHVISPWNYHAMIVNGQLVEIIRINSRLDIDWVESSPMPFELEFDFLDSKGPDFRWRVEAIQDGSELFSIEGDNASYSMVSWFDGHRLFVSALSGEVCCVLPIPIETS
jgi:hypothetical protein